MQTMRSISFEAPGQPLRLVELPVPHPGAGQVLIKSSMRAASAVPTCIL